MKIPKKIITLWRNHDKRTMAFFKQSKSTEVSRLTDEEIVERILQHNEQSRASGLEVLYDRYSPKVFHKCLSLIKDREAAKDCTHDIMVKVFMNLANFKGRSAFSLWVHSITYNYCMDYLQKQKRFDFSEYAETEYDNLASDDESLEIKKLQDLKLTQLEEMLERLHPDERLLLMMRYQDGMGVKEIAEMLGVGESAVKMRLKRTRDRLAELIDEYGKKK